MSTPSAKGLSYVMGWTEQWRWTREGVKTVWAGQVRVGSREGCARGLEVLVVAEGRM